MGGLNVWEVFQEVFGKCLGGVGDVFGKCFGCFLLEALQSHLGATPFSLPSLPAATPYCYTLPAHLTSHTLLLQLTATAPAVGSGVVGGGGCGWWRLWLVEVWAVEVVRGGRGRPGG